jgi:peptide/nickel transport system substrate-binding protein
MKRRTFVGSAAAALARPALAQGTKTITFVPQGNLVTMDPVWTTATVTRNAAAMVFETLYACDESLTPRPQMIAGALVEDDVKRWTLTLRDGLLFHDGEKVLARDCAASLKRWMRRDAAGETLAGRLDALEARDDKTLVFRLKKPFASLPAALAKTALTPAIMPARIAATDPFKEMPEVVGSGPFRYEPKEYVTGSRAVFSRNEKYQPRDEPASYASGGLRAMVDRVEWRIVPDPATAANALVTGEIDWLETPLPDLLPLLRQSPGVVVGVLDRIGSYGLLRLNWEQGPTANPGVRRAMLAAIDQVEMMTAVMGEDRTLFNAPVGVFVPGSAGASEAGMELVRTRKSIPELKAMLRDAGYQGEKLVVFDPTDQVFYHAMIGVAAQAFREIGMNVDQVATDWGTVIQRRNSHEPMDKGGWSVFPGTQPASEYIDPLLPKCIRANGRDAWFGWPADAMLETLREQWIDETDAAKQKELCARIQARCLDLVTLIPTGQYLPPAAWSKKLSAPLRGLTPVFWNLTKA